MGRRSLCDALARVRSLTSVLGCYVREQHLVRAATKEFQTGLWYDCLFLLFILKIMLTPSPGTLRMGGVMMREDRGLQEGTEYILASLSLVTFGKPRLPSVFRGAGSILDMLCLRSRGNS